MIYHKGTYALVDRDDGTIIELGIVSSVQDNLKSGITKTPIPTMHAENTFVFDNGITESFTLRFCRVNPHAEFDEEDSLTWSNAFWMNRLSAFINRWQLKTDGCKLRFQPMDDTEEAEEYDSIDDLNVYLSQLRFDWKAGEPEMISGSVTIKVGSIYATRYSSSNDSEYTRLLNDMYITISDASRLNSYLIMSNELEVNCVKEYTITGGINQPFEMLTMKIPKKRLVSVAPDLVDNIIVGKSQIELSAYGSGIFIVTKCSLSKTDYSITAYAISELIKSRTTDTAYDRATRPLSIMQEILRKGIVINGSTINYIDYGNSSSTLVVGIDNANNIWNGDVSFPIGSNAWKVLQICALKLGAKIWFSEDKCYIVDTRVSEEDKERLPGTFTTDYGAITLFAEYGTLHKDVVGNAESGDESTSTVSNVIEVSYSQYNEESKQYETLTEIVEDRASIDYYGEKQGNKLNLSDFIFNRNDAVMMCENQMSYIRDSQVSIGYTVKEIVATALGQGWIRTYDYSAMATEVYDDVNEIRAKNISRSREGSLPTDTFNNLLTLSSYERKFPAGTSKYWWGVQQATDLSQTMSNIQNAINRG